MNSFANKLRFHMNTAKHTKVSLAEKSGIPLDKISQVLNSDGNFNDKELALVEKILSINSNYADENDKVKNNGLIYFSAAQSQQTRRLI